jgi:hypothetical protein
VQTELLESESDGFARLPRSDHGDFEHSLPWLVRKSVQGIAEHLHVDSNLSLEVTKPSLPSLTRRRSVQTLGHREVRGNIELLR